LGFIFNFPKIVIENFVKLNIKLIWSFIMRVKIINELRTSPTVAPVATGTPAANSTAPTAPTASVQPHAIDPKLLPAIQKQIADALQAPIQAAIANVLKNIQVT
jgi:hypothetical protein